MDHKLYENKINYRKLTRGNTYDSILCMNDRARMWPKNI